MLDSAPVKVSNVVGTEDEVTVLHELPIRRLLGNLQSAAFTVGPDFDDDGLVAVHAFFQRFKALFPKRIRFDRPLRDFDHCPT